MTQEALSSLDRCIEILRRTNDGNRLSPSHLHLVQAMTSPTFYGVTTAAEIAFDELYRKVMDGSYDRDTIWFWGIEHLTRDHEGYVLWRGKVVEHYSFPADGKDRERAAAEKLAGRCRSLEARGLPVNGSTVLFPLFEQMPAGSPFLPLLLALYTAFTDESGRPVCIIVRRPDGSARALSFKDGQLVAEGFPGAYEAYHGCGFVRTPGESNLMDSYARTVALLEAGGFTPDVVAPFLQ